MSRSSVELHGATPRELHTRIEAERRGTPFVVYRDGDRAHVIVELAEFGERLTIGRRIDNDIALEWDPQVSRIRARAHRLGSG